MVTTYELKRNPIDKNRIIKIAKDIIKANNHDRDTALAMHDHFKGIATDGEVEEPYRLQANKLAVDCLKLAQSAGEKSVKLIDSLLKAAVINSGSKSEETADDLGFEEISKKANAG